MIFDTIAAIATPPGEGGIGIIRVSGSDSWNLVNSFFRAANGRPLLSFSSHTINYGYFVDADGKVLDECLVTVMKAPRTFTREDVVEINCHGGYLALQQIMKVLLSHGARLAEPGEFTKRAFINGRIDLAQAESIIDIIRAKTAYGLDLAVQQLRGSLSGEIRELRQKILSLLAAFEANIDFPEEDVPPVDYRQVEQEIKEILSQVERLINSWDEGKIYRDGLKTVIVGRPNVGKSSLLNLLAKEERAIVTDIPGTTRDVIEELVNIQGIPLRIMDTAGIRETDDLVEKLGVERSLQLIDQADLVLLVIDLTSPLAQEDRLILEKATEKKIIVLLNKVDLAHSNANVREVKKLVGDNPVLKISAKEQEGMDQLYETIKELVLTGKVIMGEQASVTNARHYAALVKGAESLQNLLAGLEQDLPVDFLSIDLTAAYDYLGEITGETVGEDLLDKIFADFCIGK